MAKTPRERWMTALRSGKYRQTKGTLADQDGHCCLGVACDLAVKAGIIPPPVKVGSKYYTLIFDDHAMTLPESVRTWLGLRTRTDHTDDFSVSLSKQNDDGATFAEIADIIDKSPEGLFIKEK